MKKAHLNNITLSYQTSGKGDPLVLLHGLQGDSSSYDSIVPLLSQHYTVLNFDQRGSGYSDKPDMEYSIELFADDTVQLLKHVGFEQAHIVGMSLGGMIGQALAIHHPQYVRSLTMGCTLPGGWEQGIPCKPDEDILLAFSPDDTIDPIVRATALAKSTYSADFLKQRPDIINLLAKQRQNRPIETIGLKRRSSCTDRFKAFSQLSNIKCPCLIVTGQQDKIVPAENSAVLAQQIPQASVTYFENAGHCFWDEAPNKLLSVLQKFHKNM